MIASGEVKRSEPGLVWVEVKRSQSCERCADLGGCLSGGMCASATQTFCLSAPRGIVPGDRIDLVVPDGAVAHAALLAYGFPLAGLLAGGVLTVALGGGSDLLVLSGALLGMASGVGVSVYRRRRMPGAWLAPVLLDPRRPDVSNPE